MAVTGLWRTQRLWVDRPEPLGRPEYSEQHMDPDTDQPGSRPKDVAPRLAATPASVDDPGTAYDPVYPSQAPGLVLDHTPVTHEGDGGAGGLQSLYRAQAQGNAARSIDTGADMRQLYVPPAARGHDERRQTSALVVDSISAGSRAAVFRGANSLPENNPDGFRPGVRIQRFVDRRVWNRHRRHDLRPLLEMTAAAAVESPPLEGGGNRLTSPFSWSVKARRRNASAPMMRREPRAWDESAETDGMEPAAPSGGEFQSWGL